MVEKRFTIWLCPDCGEQISDERQYDRDRNEYVRGHYHDPPVGWHTEDGPLKEDPWFDAVEVPVVPTDLDRSNLDPPEPGASGPENSQAGEVHVESEMKAAA